ncbi:beclin 1-associated autophagy-related key regulator-like [Oppia nitens]|uniref:beclin 1-associated autophagy-related key regulator-like n=1 Tax=Oppia nitens TaxID=1686743 RepID=UPI0023DB0E40|nr:beclin 1-associated autophagy-related key regulator-like [Oppia nitens]
MSRMSSESSTRPQNIPLVDHNAVDSHFSDNSDHSLMISSLKKSSDHTINQSLPNERSAKYVMTCRVCGHDRCTFFCMDCVRKGDFYGISKTRIREIFAEKKLKYFRLKDEQRLISETIDRHLNDLMIKEELEFKIRLIESNGECLQNSLTKAKQKLNSSEDNLRKTVANQSECKVRCNKLKDKVKDAKQYLNKRHNNINKTNDDKDNCDEDIKVMAKQRVKQLTTFIFPIEAKEGVIDSNDCHSLTSSESTPLLEPISYSPNPSNYSIVEPWINGNGDYSLFALFATNERDYPNKDSCYRNARYRICAALAYITQLISLIAFYLDIRLPKRLTYSEFYLSDLNETQFIHKVAKLNTNIVYLCLSQNLDSELLIGRLTVKNLLHLLNSSPNLGIRNRPIIVRSDFLENLEDCLLEDLELLEDVVDIGSDQNDENLIVEYDWVENNIPDLQLNDVQQTSIASNVISTLSSFFRS